MCASTTAANRRRSVARSPGARSRQAGKAAWARSMAASVSARSARGTSVTGVAVAGLTTVKVLLDTIPPYSRSKPRRSSQSVTAASYAVSSTSAMLT